MKPTTSIWALQVVMVMLLLVVLLNATIVVTGDHPHDLHGWISKLSSSFMFLSLSFLMWTTSLNLKRRQAGDQASTPFQGKLFAVGFVMMSVASIALIAIGVIELAGR
jgi:hypothetical protein